MHYHLEIILPPTEDIEAAVAQVMAPFQEEPSDSDDEENSNYPFWDFYVIGGRYAGEKLKALLGEDEINAFSDKLKDLNITVSGVRCGKETLEPYSQVAIIDKLWNEAFPNSPVKKCPFFSHFNNQYVHSVGYPDVMKLGELPMGFKASKVIIAGPHWEGHPGKLEAKRMDKDAIYNGVDYQTTTWDTRVHSSVTAYVQQLSNASEERKATHVPTDDWLVVTVDYHS
jgi:hypothetical protein